MTPKEIRSLALRAYRAAARRKNAPAAILPAEAKRAISEKTGIPVSRLASLVDPVYFRENGIRNPLPASAAKSAASLRSAVRKRRDAGGTLGRWESLAASASATLGRPVSEAAVRALYADAGGDLAASYVGRGTRIAAPKTRESETAEVDTTLA
jgi:hypothetical protein